MMTTSAPLESTSATRIASDTTLGPVRLTVSQLERSRAFYEQALGLLATVPLATTIGHVHLQVADLAEAEAFYHGVLGFDVMVRGYPGALFVSAGGYHHHIGLNTWHSAGAAPAPAESVGLRAFTVELPN